MRPATATVLPPASAQRMWEDHQALSKLSEEGLGVTRLAYTSLEREAHEQFRDWMREEGCTVASDAAGNTIATRPGSLDGPAVGTGSHLDTVYNGGRFDGITGVVAAVEAARLLAESGAQTEYPIRFVAFAGEEGARFGQACVGSKLAAGLSPRPELDQRRDRDGISIAEAMHILGLNPDVAAATPWRSEEWQAFVELHVEQGTVLERGAIDVGVVDLISGSTRLEITLDGQASHTGGTPMDARTDALAAASEAVLAAEALALSRHNRGTRATVGRLIVEPCSITTIPGKVTFSVDLRDVDADRQRQVTGQFIDELRSLCQRRGIKERVRLLADTSPVVLPARVRQEIIALARARNISYRVMTSGASHDAQMINRVTPTAMIFVPSRGGLSHVPEEWTDPSNLARGTDLLAASLQRLACPSDPSAGSTPGTHQTPSGRRQTDAATD